MTSRTNFCLVLLLVLGVSMPFLASAYWLSLITQILIFGMLALGVELMLGHAGLFSLCHAAFFSVAAYTVAILQVRYGLPTVIAAPAGIFLGTLLGCIFGLSVRTRGVYFILVTLAMGYIIWGVGYRWASFTGGDSGVTNIPAPEVAGFSAADPMAYYYLVLVVLSLTLFAYRRLIYSPLGLVLRGIKSGEKRMLSLGFNPAAHLYIAFVISAMIASLAGVLYAYFNKFVNPVSASLHISVEAVLMGIVGGTGTILGPLIGAGLVLGLRNWVSSFFTLHLAVMGLVFIAVVIWAPGGVMGIFKKWLTDAKER